MVWPMIAAGISAASNLIGGVLQGERQERTNMLNMSQADAANRMSQANMDRQFQAEHQRFERQLQEQRDFAQHGIRWRVEDAIASGLHPMYALGGQPIQFSPISVGGGGGGSFQAAQLSSGSGGLGAGLAAAGQDISRAINATRTAEERQVAATMASLGLERAGLENELLRSQIAKNIAAANPPMAGTSFNIPGQPDSGQSSSIASGLIKSEPMEQTKSAPGAPHSEPGAITDVGYARTSTGWAPVPSKDVKERIEDQIIPELMWSIRNNLMPSIGVNQAPPPFEAPAGKTWIFYRPMQEYRLVDSEPSGRRYVPPGGYMHERR